MAPMQFAGHRLRGLTVIGRSVLGKPILEASFGSGRRRVLLVAGVHGNEFGSRVAGLFVTYLEHHPRALPKGIRVDVVPCANPDGTALGTRDNAHGVDINRNFPSADWAVARYHVRADGPGAGSEPETRALVGLLRFGYARVISLHSSGAIVDYDGPRSLAIAVRAARAMGYSVGHLPYEKTITGSLGRYVGERYAVPVITIELSGRRLSGRVIGGLEAAIR